MRRHALNCRIHTCSRWERLFTSQCRYFSTTSRRICSLTTPTLTGRDKEAEPQSAPQHPILAYPHKVVDTESALEESIDLLSHATSIALDVEAFCTPADVQTRHLGTISLVQACSDVSSTVYLFDALALRGVFRDKFKAILQNSDIVKYFFDCRRDVEALSCQMQLTPANVIDLQIYFTALQWKLRGVNRRSGMPYVLKQVAGVERQESDNFVQTAMTEGNRLVWDVRPLPPHFLAYAASDVRYILLLSQYFRAGPRSGQQRGEAAPAAAPALPLDLVSESAVRRLTAAYVEHYACGAPVAAEMDPKPAEMNRLWLERFVGPGGTCKYCGSRGHTESECFKRAQSVVKCSFCGQTGHTERSCYQKHPELLKCGVCGQIGHTSAHCFKKNPCKHCGGLHNSANCHRIAKVG
ncbi:hypothetical protein STCU_06048 [Strigomonas culicis]|uniref:CCHC-type domain-containing protein n=1 Tax=Strigomonas culicis TaxID=28005 RepID=S9UD35_9TRYP|nr:hypothetical protein STCU_07450 [Strigomonas culicis]EPY26848.1 hypothetical protein STCU_06048 [Strigomonas culicis]|eukprot:EPY23800.1 hypothetical protein STCU_07450 [Strigomonas culicis]